MDAAGFVLIDRHQLAVARDTNQRAAASQLLPLKGAVVGCNTAATLEPVPRRYGTA
ncbi:hypothetical protein LMG23992_04130 [Cupriavidus laharis]|uniref:Uncharacterized protein n=1 Tax=Cupriavidus laharis TaxID=151654 RepID=A0ABN7Z5H2_9BURK|nr:hypothetical protein [Cupriavidus laharis]CAG9179976.1 hypothetical protein LMG23992_04130 [Cupriavidus laharis]